MTTLALVPARGGSKGLPGKNLALVGGRSLVARAVDVALRVDRVDEVVVSSDADDILTAGRAAGAQTHVRPAALAADTAPTMDLIRALLAERPDVSVLVVLQPTSPLRAPEDVERCLDALAGAPAATTVSAVGHPSEWLMRIDAHRLVPLAGWEGLARRRQEAEPVYELNGAVYTVLAAHVAAGGALVGPDTAAVVMPRERAVDVDDHLGLAVARALAERVASGA